MIDDQKSIDPKKLEEYAAALEELKRRKTENRLSFYEPYPKQKEFHAIGANSRERLLMAGNQLGKTFSGGAELAMHLTGQYPDWWPGRRFDRPIRAWASGVTAESVRDTVQRIMLGPLGQHGSGAIPKDCIMSKSTSRGIADSVDTVLVKHATGALSQLSFKSYERGREKWQGETLDVIWLDEEPPEEIYSEALARVTATNGFLYLTFTPLLGMSSVVRRFLNEPSPDRGVVTMTIDDALHISAEQRDRIISGYLPHEREARVRGIPMLGSGRIYQVAEEMILCDPFKIPEHFARIVGIDFGYDHPFAAVWLAWDRDTDTVYVTDALKVKGQTAIMHAGTIKTRGGDWLPVAWPHDGLQSEKSSGETLASQYKKQGLRMLSTHARFEDGGNSVEAGIMLMLERMQTGRLRIFPHLLEWLDEFRQYHRKDGRIVKTNDDLLDATRYAVMMLKYARTRPDFMQGHVRMARDVEYDLLDRGGDSAPMQRTPGVTWGEPTREKIFGRRRNEGAASNTDYPMWGE